MSDTSIIDSLAQELNAAPFGAGKENGEQGTIGWLMERVGHVTCSRLRDVMDFTKAGKPGAKRAAYMWELVIERLTNKPAQHFESTAMQWGTQQEPLARMAYEATTGEMVMEVGFRKHRELEWVGGSADGLLGDDGGIEIKCPWNSANHLQCWLTGCPEDHMAQIQGLMWVLWRQYWDFVSYDERMPEKLRLYVLRIERDEAYIEQLESQVQTFLAEVQALYNSLAGQ